MAIECACQAKHDRGGWARLWRACPSFARLAGGSACPTLAAHTLKCPKSRAALRAAGPA